MKRIISLSLISAICISALIGLMAFKSSETLSSNIIIKAKLAGGGSTWKKRSYIKIFKPDGTSEVQYPFLKEAIWEDDEAYITQVMVVVSKYQQMGYEIISFNECAIGNAFFTYNFVLSKK